MFRGFSFIERLSKYPTVMIMIQMLQVCIPTLNTQTSCPQQIQIINVRLMILAADLPHMCPPLSSTWSAQPQQKEYYKRIRQRGRRGQT